MTVDVPPSPPATYRVSALASALGAMWRTSRWALPAILLNAAVQSALMYWDVPSGFTSRFLLAFVISGACALLLYAVLAASALEAVDAGSGPVLARVGRNLAWFTVWVLAQWALIAVVSVVHQVLILLVAAFTPFLPLAAMDGRRAGSLGASLRAVAETFGRWLVTTLVLVGTGVVLYLLSAATTLFVKGTPAAAFFWLAIGTVAWWLLTAWAMIYRRSSVGSRRP